MKRSSSFHTHLVGQDRPSKVPRQTSRDAKPPTERGEDRRLQHPLSPFSSGCGNQDPFSQRGRTTTPRFTTNSTDRIYDWIPPARNADECDNRISPPGDLEGIDNMSQPPSKRSRSQSTSSEWDRSQSSDSERSSLRDTKSAAYRAVNYVTILETKGYFMRPSQDGLAPEDIQLCERLISQPVETPRDTLFEPQFVRDFHDTLQNRSEARLLIDLHPLLIPSAENQYIQGKDWLKDVVDGYNDPWVKTEPIYGPKPQPDHARGLKWSTFSQSQRRKLSIKPEEKSPYTAREDMYFPYLAAEIKCGNQALELADRQNMHSMCIALRAVVTLAQAAGCVETVHRRVLGFSISHELESLRIYGYYPEIDGGQTSFFRWPVARFDVWEGGNEWVCYRFVENLDREFLPIHTKRLMGFLEKIADPEDDSVCTEAADVESQSVRTDSQERPGFRRTASSQGRGLQAELRSMIQTLQMQLAEQKQQFLAQLEQQRLQEEKREAYRKAREDKLLAEQKAREDKLLAESKAREDRLLALLERE